MKGNQSVSTNMFGMCYHLLGMLGMFNYVHYNICACYREDFSANLEEF